MLGKVVVVEVSGRAMTGERSGYADALKEGFSTAQRDLKVDAKKSPSGIVKEVDQKGG